MKICIVQPNWDDTGLGAFYERGFRALGHEVTRLAPFAPSPRTLAGRLAHRLGPVLNVGRNRRCWRKTLATAASLRPDLALFTRCEEAPPDLLEEVRHVTRDRCWNIYTDHPTIIGVPKASDRPAFYDCFSTVFSHSRHVTPVHYQLGARRVRWLPFAYDPETHRPVPSPGAEGNLAYLGVWGPVVERWLLAAEPFGLAIYGHNWRRLRRSSPLRKCWRRGEGMGRGMAEAIGKHRVVLNFSRGDYDCTHTMKPFEIAASGGVCLMNRVSDNEIFFRHEDEMIYFDTMDEMREGIERLLADAPLRERLRRNALERVRGHTYESRARRLLRYHERGEWPRDKEWADPA